MDSTLDVGTHELRTRRASLPAAGNRDVAAGNGD